MGARGGPAPPLDPLLLSLDDKCCSCELMTYKVMTCSEEVMQGAGGLNSVCLVTTHHL